MRVDSRGGEGTLTGLGEDVFEQTEMSEGVGKGGNYAHTGSLDGTKFRAQPLCVYPTLA